MAEFKDLVQYFESLKSKRSCKKTNRYAGEVIRVNQNARTKLERMYAATKLSKRSLASFAIYLLNEEFEKWIQGNQSSKFGYDIEIFEVESDEKKQQVP